ncbi:MAG: hypothetical protein IH805_01160 [Proteobacteria bacterium]|nr:hypothetical protein [Pseudomonadota bacterium]
MKRFSVVAALCLPLLACVGAAPERTGFLRARANLEIPVGATGAGANWVGAVVEVVLDDIPPGYQIERVTLIDPGGGRHRAERLVPARRQSGTAVPGVLIGIAVTGGSSSGIKPALSLGFGTGLREETRIGTRVLARVPIADPAAFRDHPKRWRLEVTYLDITGDRRSVVLPVQ